MATISENMGKLPISISHQQIVAVEKMVVHWELFRTYPLTLDGPYLGIDPIHFRTVDYNALFDIFHIHPKDVETAIKNTPAINPAFAVTSDEFNILAVWLVHLAPIYIRDKHVCYQFQFNILKYLLYKFFCSVVNNSFRHGTNPGVMQATINNLSRKSDIVRYESWKLLIISHVEKILDPKDRFYKTIVDGYPDEMFLRVISENQTSLRNKIRLVAQAYYEAHAAGDKIGSVSSIAENAEGEKIIAQSASVIESATAAMQSEVLNPNMFVHDTSVRLVGGMVKSIPTRMIRTALLKINETAALQVAQRQFDDVRETKSGEKTYVGVRALIREIINSMVRICKIRHVNMGKRALVMETMRDVYRNSRILDPNVLAIKRSVAELVDSFEITTSAASQAALRLAVIYYILYRTIEKMKV